MAMAGEENQPVITSCNHCGPAFNPSTCAHQINTAPKKKPTNGSITWTDQNWWQRTLTVLGYFLTTIIAVGSGVTTAAAFMMLGLVPAGIASALVASLIFVAGTGINYYIYQSAVGDVLIDIFGKGGLFKGLMQTDDGKPLSVGRKILMSVGFLLALSAGITFGALAYSSTFSIVAAFSFLTVLSPGLPAIAATLAVVTVVALTALMLKSIADLIKTENIWKKTKDFLYNLVDINENSPQNKGKSKPRIILERSLAVLFTVAILPLAAFGLFMTMNACVPGVKEILINKIPSASAALIDGLSKAITLGLSFLGQLPFVLITALRTVTGWFTKSTNPCSVVVSDVKPTKENLEDLNFKSNSAYVRFKYKDGVETLFYVDRYKGKCDELKGLTPEQLARFDGAMQPSDRAETLSDAAVQYIAQITNHQRVTWGEWLADNVKDAIFFIGRFLNAIGNGFISWRGYAVTSGDPFTAQGVLAGGTGALNSFAAAAVDSPVQMTGELDSGPEGENKAVAKQVEGNISPTRLREIHAADKKTRFLPKSPANNSHPSILDEPILSSIGSNMHSFHQEQARKNGTTGSPIPVNQNASDNKQSPRIGARPII